VNDLILRFRRVLGGGELLFASGERAQQLAEVD
jgi:hypothetical protein